MAYTSSNIAFIALAGFCCIFFAFILPVWIYICKKRNDTIRTRRARNAIARSQINRPPPQKTPKRHDTLKKEILRKLIHTLRGLPTKKMAVDNTCTICLEKLKCTKDEEAGQSPLGMIKDCQHLFHFDCIWEWLERQKRCPLCRTQVTLSTDDIIAASADCVPSSTTTSIKGSKPSRDSLKSEGCTSSNGGIAENDSAEISGQNRKTQPSTSLAPPVDRSQRIHRSKSNETRTQSVPPEPSSSRPISPDRTRQKQSSSQHRQPSHRSILQPRSKGRKSRSRNHHHPNHHRYHRNNYHMNRATSHEPDRGEGHYPQRHNVSPLGGAGVSTHGYRDVLSMVNSDPGNIHAMDSDWVTSSLPEGLHRNREGLRRFKDINTLHPPPFSKRRPPIPE